MNNTTQATRALHAQPAPNPMGGERFQIIRKTYSESPFKGQPPILTSTKIGKFEKF